MIESRKIDWVEPAKKAFERFPKKAQEIGKDALQIAAGGQKSDNAKPLTGLGVMEVVIDYDTDTYRVVYMMKIKGYVIVVHAFQKKSKKGKKTDKQDIDLIKARVKQIKQVYK